VVGFPAYMTFTIKCVRLQGNADKFRHLVHALMSNELGPFIETKFPMTSCRQRRALYQELKGVILS
jgi:hypothetical protein